ncbi:MAG: hypothetical protein OJF62_001348 [Pseudolabrys sp.]|nr:hypothetical protein [Pseudolabrys sp.]
MSRIGTDMKRIDATRPPAWPDARQAPDEPEKPQGSRALVPVAAASPAYFIVNERPSTAFIAQLLANRDGVEQTRERRRANPAEANTAYRTNAALARSGQLSRSL